MSPKKPTILVGDDDPDFSASTTAFLEAHGYDVVEARGGREGVELARRRRPDAVLMDVMMGERTEGFFAVQALRHDPELEAVPVFVVSSIYDDVPGFRIDPGRDWIGHDEFFPKPLDMDRLLAKLEEHLAPRREPGATGTAASAAGAAAEEAP